MALLIRNEQVAAFARNRFADFEDRLLKHLRKHHEARLSGFGDDAIRAYIRTCCDRAKRLYGLETEQAIASYTEIPLLLGGDFEVDPRYKTIPDLLNRRTFESNTRAKMALSAAYWASAHAGV